MDLITRTPGLIHIAERIFSDLERNDLLQCQKVNEYWASILRNPWFWYNRMMKDTTLSQEHQKEWSKFCEKLSKSNITKDMMLGLNLIYEQLEDSWTINETYCSAIPKYESYDSDMEEDWFFQYSLKSKKTHQRTCNQRVEIIKIMSPLMKNPNARGRRGNTPIHVAALNGHMEIVKILAPLADNPNVPDELGRTPIHQAARKGHSAIHS